MHLFQVLHLTLYGAARRVKRLPSTASTETIQAVEPGEETTFLHKLIVKLFAGQ